VIILGKRLVTCKNCGTKVFKSPAEYDDHHKETHPEIESQAEEQAEDKEQNDEPSNGS
jgi:hypothetical protein